MYFFSFHLVIRSFFCEVGSYFVLDHKYSFFLKILYFEQLLLLQSVGWIKLYNNDFGKIKKSIGPVVLFSILHWVNCIDINIISTLIIFKGSIDKKIMIINHKAKLYINKLYFANQLKGEKNTVSHLKILTFPKNCDTLSTCGGIHDI